MRKTGKPQPLRRPCPGFWNARRSPRTCIRPWAVARIPPLRPSSRLNGERPGKNRHSGGSVGFQEDIAAIFHHHLGGMLQQVFADMLRDRPPRHRRHGTDPCGAPCQDHVPNDGPLRVHQTARATALSRNPVAFLYRPPGIPGAAKRIRGRSRPGRFPRTPPGPSP